MAVAVRVVSFLPLLERKPLNRRDCAHPPQEPRATGPRFGYKQVAFCSRKGGLLFKRTP